MAQHRSPIPLSSAKNVISRRQVENLIAQGRTIVIVDREVLKVDSWLRFHPGGDKAIMHMVGRDATDEVNALHSAETRALMSRYQIGRMEGKWHNFLPPIQGGAFKALQEEESIIDKEGHGEESSSSDHSLIGSPVFDVLRKKTSRTGPQGENIHDEASSSATSVTSLDMSSSDLKRETSPMDALTQSQLDSDIAKYPALDSVTQADIVCKYRILNQRIRSEGLFQCNYKAYGIEMCRYTFFVCMCMLFLRLGWYGTSGMFLGMFWHQLAFTVHDAGHMGITHNYTVDTVIGIIMADFLGGLSMGWWKRSHNVHHIVTNSPEHDPDIEHMPFFAISHRFFDSLWSTYHDKIMSFDVFAKSAIRYQNYLYYPILTLGRFNLYVQSWMFLILGLGPKKGAAAWHRWFEFAGHIFFWTWFGYGLMYKSIPTAGSRFLFLMISHMVTAPLHVQITLSHFAMSTADLGPNESFPQKMLRTTMDVDCPDWLDFFHGGLQFQAVHHLFPRLPRHNLRRAQKLVREFCTDVGIPYALYGFMDGNKEVISKLGEVGRQAAILMKCQDSLASKGDYGYH